MRWGKHFVWNHPSHLKVTKFFLFKFSHQYLTSDSSWKPKAAENRNLLLIWRFLMSGCLSAGTRAPRMPLGPAVNLPLSGRVGVHHAGRVHPGANSQRLLLHAGRGPAGQVVLDPEHLRGPDAPTAAAGVWPGEQNNTRKKTRRKTTGRRKVLQRKRISSTGRTEIGWSGWSTLSSSRSKRLDVQNQPDEQERRRGRRRRNCRRKWPQSFIQLQNFW